MKDIDINKLVEKVDIVDVISNFSTLTKSGASFKTLCNVHGDKSPSLSINVKKQIYKCFVCDHGGNALDYLIWAQGFSFPDAVEYLIKESGDNPEDYSIVNRKKHSDKEIALFKSNNDACDLFNYYLNIYLDEKNYVYEYIKKRNIDKKIIDKFKLGFAPSIKDQDYLTLLEKKGNEKSTLINSSLLSENGNYPFFNDRLMFPIFDENNKVIAFSGRKINDLIDGPKYINSKESLIFKKNKVIYNYNNAKKFKELIIVEGYMDVIAFSKIGKDNVVALMGLALSSDHIEIFKKHSEIGIFLDSDSAGQIATLKLVRLFVSNNINSYILWNSFNKDADEILNSDNGHKKLESILNNKVNLTDFIFDHFTKDLEKNDFEKMKKTIIEIYKYSKPFDEFIKLNLIDKLSKKFEIDKEIIFNYFNYKPNVVELKKLEKKNINTKQTLEIELNEPLNINKLLISIWQNVSFLESQNIESIHWPKAEYIKIYKEIRNYHLQGNPISKKTEDFINEKQRFFVSKQSLPKSMEDFNELILRTKKETIDAKISYIDELILKEKDSDKKHELLSKKLELISRKEK